MKTIYSICMFLIAGFGLNAQMAQVPFTHANKTVPGRPISPGELAKKMRNHNHSVQTSYWINYGVCMDSSIVGPDVAELNSNYLCTDSSMLGNFGTGGYAGVWVNNIGDILDVHSSNVVNYYGNNWGNAPYSVDSMSIMYAYTRALPANIVDTLIVALYYNSTNPIMPTYYFTGMAANFGSDTLYFKAMLYSYLTNLPSASNKIIVKVPLTDADTAVALYRFKDFATNYSVPGGKLVSASLTFKPGYTYNVGDTIDRKNAFFFTSYEEGGGGASGGTFPLYTYCPSTTSSACDWNVSQIVTSDVRYNNAGGWNGFFIPSYAYTIPYAFEHHLIWYKVTSPPMGVEDNNVANFQLDQNIPNPSNGNTLINYSLVKSAHVALTVYDVAGKQVMVFDKGHLNAGQYHIDLNTSTLSPGVYFYTLTVDGEQATRRLEVTE